MKSLTTISLISMLFLGLILPGNSSSAQVTDDTFIYSLIIDKTGSMMGRGDGMGDTIWFETQDYLMEFADMINLNTKVIIYTFHGTVDPPVSFYLQNESVKQEMKSFIRNIVPDGRNTAIYDALDKSLSDLEENYPDNPKLIYMITDGEDNASELKFEDIITKFSAQRGEFDHLYYIDLRNRATREDQEKIEDDEHIHLLPGFNRLVEIRPWFNPIPVALETEEKTEIIQDFEIRGFDLPDDFMFDCRLEVSPALNINLDLLPSINIDGSRLEKVEEGRYRMRFEMELLAGVIDEPVNVKARLSAKSVTSIASGTADLREYDFVNRNRIDPNNPIYSYELEYEYDFNFNPAVFDLNIDLNVPRVVATEGGWVYEIDTLRNRETTQKQLELFFNEKSKEEDSYITWELRGEDWEDVNVSFNQGRFRDNRFTIRAKEYKEFADGDDGIILNISPRKNTEEKEYTFRFEVVEGSDDLRFNESELNMRSSFYIIPPPPTPWWLTLLYILAAAFVLFHILWFAFLKRMLYPKMNGTLQFSDGSIIKLRDSYKFILYTSHKKPAIAKGGLLSEIYCGKTGSFQMPYPDELRSDNKYIVIKPVKGRKGYLNNLEEIRNIEFLSNNKKLYHEEEYSFKDALDDMVVSFVYDNMKHQM